MSPDMEAPSSGRVGRLLDAFDERMPALFHYDFHMSFKGYTLAGALLFLGFFCSSALFFAVLDLRDFRVAGMGAPLVALHIIAAITWFFSLVASSVSTPKIKPRDKSSQDDFKLLLITGIDPDSLVLGKFLSGAAFCLITLSMSAPFMLCGVLMKGGAGALYGVCSILFLLATLAPTLMMQQMGMAAFLSGTTGTVSGILSLSAMLSIICHYGASFFIVSLSIQSGGTGLAGALAMLFAGSAHLLALFFFGAVFNLQVPSVRSLFRPKLFGLASALLFPAGLMLVNIKPKFRELEFLGLFLLPAALAVMSCWTPFGPAPKCVRRAWQGRRLLLHLRPLLYDGRGADIMFTAVTLLVLTFWGYAICKDDDLARMIFPAMSLLALVSIISNLFRYFLKTSTSLELSFCGAIIVGALSLLVISLHEIFLVFDEFAETLSDGISFCRPEILAAGFWCAIFVYGLKCHWRQLKLEEGLPAIDGKAILEQGGSEAR